MALSRYLCFFRSFCHPALLCSELSEADLPQLHQWACCSLGSGWVSLVLQKAHVRTRGRRRERAREESEVGVFLFLYPSLLDHLGWWTVFLSLRSEPLQMALHLSENLLGFSSHSLALPVQVYHGTTPRQTECWTIPVVSLYPPLLFANRLFSKFLNLPVPTKTLYWYCGLGWLAALPRILKMEQIMHKRTTVGDWFVPATVASKGGSSSASVSAGLL